MHLPQIHVIMNVVKHEVVVAESLRYRILAQLARNEHLVTCLDIEQEHCLCNLDAGKLKSDVELAPSDCHFYKGPEPSQRLSDTEALDLPQYEVSMIHQCIERVRLLIFLAFLAESGRSEVPERI